MEELMHRLNSKISRLQESLKKYEDLRHKTKGQYGWRCEAIYAQIEALIQLKDNELENWDICYIEDLAEAKKEGFKL